MPDKTIIGTSLGAKYLGGGRCRFLVWAPWAETVELHLVAAGESRVAMESAGGGYHQVVVDDAGPGSLYLYDLGGASERPDPASHSQPLGVHGPSEVVDDDFDWEDTCWPGLPLPEYVLYELHTGAFTPEGTFDGIRSRLDYLTGLGITALEIMPVAQFPGERNWGYDGVYPFAVQPSYGGATGLKRLVNDCHKRGLAVVLDVVYNHLGPEGNYLSDFGPYFTDRYKTPWGMAVNFDGPDSDEVRRFFVENALYWVTEFHVDALRLDAVHGIFDQSAHAFLEELAERVHARARSLNRRIYVIAESDLNDPRLIRPPELGGYGLDAQWSDDFHHAIHVLLTGESNGYYRDFGSVEQLARAFRDGYVYTGQYSAHRQRRFGRPPRPAKARQFVVCAQNHDQVGNRMLGERLTQLVPFEGLKLAAGAVLLSPFVPLLFMGEEYGEEAPFQYFVSHLDLQLVEAVRSGRRREFAAFAWQDEPPDPQDAATFQRSKLDHQLRTKGGHRTLLEFYKELIRLRRRLPALASGEGGGTRAVAYENQRVLFVHLCGVGGELFLALNFGSSGVSIDPPVPPGRWIRTLESADQRWGGPGSAAPAQLDSEAATSLALAGLSFVLFEKE